MENTKKKILLLAQRTGSLKSQQIVKALGITRQAAAKHLKQLVEAGILEKKGATKGANYTPVSKKREQASRHLIFVKKIKNLQEDHVYDEVLRRLPIKKLLNKNTQNIFSYAFGEMLNNAIDHSKSSNVQIQVSLEQGVCSFRVKDHGIGAFFNVKKIFRLQDEYEAAEHLFKGKQTTDPKNHSGQGIFFTSRIADIFFIRSHAFQATVNNQKNDLSFQDMRSVAGTEVFFSIKQKSKKILEKVFKDFANENYEFDKNEVRLKLTPHQELVSRSQARRLLVGLEKFERIIFNFAGISSVGQAFADEIFRVFPRRHPQIFVSYSNATPAAEFMIRRALSNSEKK